MVFISHRFSSFLHGRGFGKFPGGGGILPGLACAACGANCSRTAKSQKLTSTDSVDFHLNHLIPNLFSSKMQEPHCFSNWWFLMLLDAFSFVLKRPDVIQLVLAAAIRMAVRPTLPMSHGGTIHILCSGWQKRIWLPSGHNTEFERLHQKQYIAIYSKIL